MASNGPPPRYSQHQQETQNFWDFLRNMDINRPAPGVDHVSGPPHPPHPHPPHPPHPGHPPHPPHPPHSPHPPPFFGFGPGGPHPGPGGPWGAGPWAFAEGWAGPWGGRRGSWRRRHRDDPYNYYDLTTDDEDADRGAAADQNNGERDVNMEGAGDSDEKEKEKYGEKEKEDSPDTMRDTPADAAAPAGEESGSGQRGGGRRGRSHSRHNHHHAHHGFGCGRGRGGFGRGGAFGFGFGPRGPPHRRGGWRDVPSQPPFDFSQLGQMFANMSQQIPQHVRDNVRNALRMAAEAAGVGGGVDNNRDNVNDDDHDEEAFTPPVDVFDTGANGAWVIHVALPGAKKEDVGVHWDSDKGVLAIMGVIYRPGDEAFLNGMVSTERRVGLFKREVRLPPPSMSRSPQGQGQQQQQQQQEAGEVSDPAGGQVREEIDADHITARMEDGVLIITVPRAEKEWTEIRKVDIQ